MNDLPDFDPYSDVFFNDPYDVYRRLRDEAPVYRNDHYGFYALSRYDDVVAAHRDWRTFTSTQGITIDMLTDPGGSALLAAATGSIIFMDPPDHDRMRGLVSRVFTPKAVADLEPMIRELVHKYLDRLDGDEVDLVADFSGPFPVEVISHILGVPEAGPPADPALDRHDAPPRSRQPEAHAGRHGGGPAPRDLRPRARAGEAGAADRRHGLRAVRGGADRRRGRRVLHAPRRRGQRDGHQAHRQRGRALRRGIPTSGGRSSRIAACSSPRRRRSCGTGRRRSTRAGGAPRRRSGTA